MLVLRTFRIIFLAGVGARRAGDRADGSDQRSGRGSAAAAQPVTATGKLIYTPADFARFAPKTAYDMLIQIPSFTIRAASSDRGLGQASENVLINGERITNKIRRRRSAPVDELHRVAISNVERIEIVDAASLGIAGLSGQVANVILKAKKASAGSSSGDPTSAPIIAKPNLFRGSVSYTGTAGPGRLHLVGQGPGRPRRRSAGRSSFTTATVSLTERRHEVYHSEIRPRDLPDQVRARRPRSSVGNLTLGYTPYWTPTHIRDRRDLVTGDRPRADHRPEARRLLLSTSTRDYEFALGPGRLKLIGLRHRDHEPLVTTQVTAFRRRIGSRSASASVATRIIGETIGRAEYGWKTGKNDWQVSFERAFNSLDQKGGLFDSATGRRVRRSRLPRRHRQGHEVRYEGIATLSRPLTSNLDLQVAAGGEISQARPRRRRPAGPQILPAQGQRHARLAPGQGLGRQLQAAPPRRPDQLLRFPRPAQA